MMDMTHIQYQGETLIPGDPPHPNANHTKLPRYDAYPIPCPNAPLPAGISVSPGISYKFHIYDRREAGQVKVSKTFAHSSWWCSRDATVLGQGADNIGPPLFLHATRGDWD